MIISQTESFQNVKKGKHCNLIQMDKVIDDKILEKKVDILIEADSKEMADLITKDILKAIKKYENFSI